MGERGPAGSSYRPVFWVYCNAAIDLLRLGATGAERGPDGVPETSLDYALVFYSNGDTEVQCKAGIGSAQNGSSSSYFPSPTRGAMTGACIADADIPTPGATTGEVGYWSFDVVTAACPRAAYNDVDNPLGLNGYSYKYSEKDCNAQMMDADGQWTKVTLADVF